ncbi:TssQ family T6SS-associated lipoprotein [Achromobacter insolitus]|uniref:TssQ family T6SS-associated lipoprotein n=1 Tax=Achromobacter insolitus TaxID=217204 RepID=UPI00241E3687|nr:TssQ family T6SS-associated lipoprotein [Achromobacter insolitus]
MCLKSTLALLAACASTPSPQAVEALQQVRDEYAASRFGAVVRTVATSDALATAPTAVRVEALKLQAFSYCVTNYRQLCEDSFVRILQLQPSFQLAPNEAGHPQWGPAFQAAQASQTR